ncbi:MAG: NCS2 family permease [Clostridiales bacterium]|nr:NCS2 family permease [Clostridiales bacterium]
MEKTKEEAKTTSKADSKEKAASASNESGFERVFKLKQNGTTIRTEIIAGLTTFMTMAYIIALNPNLLTGFGAEGQELWNGVFLATCIASAIGTICMALLANKPFVMAPGMGLNSFFALVVSNIVTMTGMTYLRSFQSALVIVFIEGLIFIALSILNIREKIVEAIPLGVRLGIGPAIGLMLMNIGFGSNAGVYSDKGGPFYGMRDFFGALTADAARDNIGDGYNMMILIVATMFIGLFAIVALNHKKVKGSVLYGMLISSVIYWAGEAVFFDTNPFESLKSASFVPPFKDMVDTTLFKLDFKGFTEIGWFTIITLVVTFCIIDMFDTIGTLVGTASRAKMLDKDGNMPKMKEALLSDAIGTVTGSVTGTSTVTTFVESASGVEAGGRTGLTALVTAIMFLLCMFIAPIAAIIPPAATSAALIYVGILMLGNLKDVNFGDTAQLVPVGIMLLAMPVSGSIGHGIGLALISFTAIKVFTGKAKDVSWLTYVLSMIFLVKFFVAF